MSTPLHSCTLASPVGTLTLVATDRGLRAVLWDDEGEAQRVRHLDGAAPDPAHPVLAQATIELREYFAGTRMAFSVPLDVVGTAFQRSAWDALRTIPFGSTVSYLEQARRLGNPKAVRAVGGANGRNPVSIIVPCHRVVGTNGALVGFAGGLDTKAWLLDHERAVLARS
jgi:methylated-DNA-[protein]-cysteine S-methyltransferase